MNICIEQGKYIESLKEDFDRVYSLESALLDYHRQLPNYIGNFCLILKKFGLEGPIIMRSNFEKYRKSLIAKIMLAPGYPGNLEKQIQYLNTMISETCCQLLGLVQIVEESFLPNFRGQLISSTTNVNNISNNVNETYKNWKNIYSEIEENENNLNIQIKKLKSKKNLIKKHTYAVRISNLIKKQKYLSKKINIAYLKFNKTIQGSYELMKASNSARTNTVIDFIDLISDYCINSSQVYNDRYKEIHKLNTSKQSEDASVSDLINYAISHKIMRTSVGSESYEQYTFKSKEIGAYVVPPYIPGQFYEPPIFTAEAILDFDGVNENEISCRVGQTIYIYEPPNDMWTLASTNKEFPQGYIPSRCIKINIQRTALSLKCSSYNGEWLGVFPGEFLVIESEDNNCYICQNTSGRVGKIEKSLVIVE
ncbi:Variant SH3 domain containing protein [Trichomonas vaginalis G3]|uniref:Variant SH3 domain containing protein n=1 Tax=Trichomonas vaginalis (strain ATCC PRA-98 / G3) TaxID=412133 RepID=A2E9J1_TRIV3|nr:SH3-domain family [Trichomonas vaginalis G3]EAY10642.1 Variant SH3 domain containing protein [Trichomonas vaginalis G3]KAI5512219.1 SH3-domain family [Trichomonas vaginalis G3]|eukprot:XP_001322865.1 Variant SH3 domain containing protein [Trichomonas vaginalis G3]